MKTIGTLAETMTHEQKRMTVDALRMSTRDEAGPWPTLKSLPFFTRRFAAQCLKNNKSKMTDAGVAISRTILSLLQK